MNTPHILIVEDEAPIRQLLRFSLEPEDFTVCEAENTQIARQAIANKMPDLILVDWMLPNESGIEFIKFLKRKAQTHSIPIIMLTAHAEESNKLQGFGVGADDYVTKPFSPKELIARIKSILRRGILVSPHNIINFRELKIDLAAHEVYLQDEALNLSPFEYQLLVFFIKHPNQTFSRSQLLDRLGENNQDSSDRSIDAHIKRLRSRLKRHNYNQFIETVHGSGYRWRES